MTPDERQFVTLQAQHHALQGTLFTLEYAVEEYEYKRTDAASMFRNPEVLAALQERGIELDHYDIDVDVIETVPEAFRKRGLTAEQLAVANTMLDLFDGRSHKKKLQDLNISSTRYNTWMKDPVFATYLRERAEAMLGENMHEAHLALLDKVRMGDSKALGLYYEITERYIKQNQSPVGVVNGSSNEFDLKAIIVKIIEIINDEVHDPATSMRISDRLRNLITARTIAGQLIEGEEEPIAVPIVAPVRELEVSG